MAIWLVALLLVAASMHYMFQAGCAGDLKGGSLGNFALALDREETGMLLESCALVLGLAAIGLNKTLSMIQRIGIGVLFFAFALAALMLAGIQFEVWGVQACF